MKTAALFLLVTLTSTAAAAQIPTNDPVAEAPYRFGVLGLAPRIGLTNIGIDTNVFNEVNNPKQDFTTTLQTGGEMWLRTGKGLLSVDGTLESIYFAEYSSESSVNSNAKGQYEFRFNKVRPYASAATINRRDRPGFEIDKRIRHYESDYHVGSDLRVASKGAVRLDFRHRDYTIPSDEVYQGRNLSEELNRTLKVVNVGWRQRLTSLTTWVTQVSKESERFDENTIRNSDSFRMSSGFELGQFALIRGNAFVGFRKLTPADGGLLPEFSGVTADVDVSYTAPTQTRLSVAVDRDVQYSYERRTPYYLQTGWTLRLTQRLVGRFDGQVSGGRDRLDYQALADALPDARTDYVDRLGGGIGYRLGEEVRLGFDVTNYARRSDLPGREYSGLRAGVSVTYGY
jgi:hypothetical protein